MESGLIGVWSCQETGSSFKSRFSPGSGRPALVAHRGPCKHLYLYSDHEEHGFMSVRIQTWFPYHVQVSMNGREWMARTLQRLGVPFAMAGNKVLACDDFAAAQLALDQQLDTRWTEALDGFLATAFPTMKETLGDGLDYYWTLWQSEWATDFIADSPRDLQQVMDGLLRHAFMTGTSQRVLRYMGHPVTRLGYPRANSGVQVSSRLLEFGEGARVRHWAGANSVKVYNEHNVLRVETTMNDPGAFRVWRRTAGSAEDSPKRLLPLRKGTADTVLRARVSQDVNERMIANLAETRAERPVAELLLPVTSPVAKDSRRARPLNPTGRDLELLRAMADPAFGVDGISNRGLRAKLAGTPWGAGRSAQQLSARVSRHLRLLRDHGLIRKCPGRRRYLLTPKGRETTTALFAALAASTEKLMEMAA